MDLIAVFTIVANGFGIYTAEKHVAYCIDLCNSYIINKIRLTHSPLTHVSTDKAQLSQNNCIQADLGDWHYPQVLLILPHTGPQNTTTWGSWGSWSTCSQTCNGGIRYRTRSCVGGTTCTGSNIEKQRCNTNPCSSKCRLFYFKCDWYTIDLTCSYRGIIIKYTSHSECTPVVPIPSLAHTPMWELTLESD